jgi:hypothetical protein
MKGWIGWPMGDSPSFPHEMNIQKHFVILT